MSALSVFGRSSMRGAERRVAAAAPLSSPIIARGSCFEPTIMAKITGAESITAHSWKYQWQSVALGDTPVVPTIASAARTHASDGFAYNLCEVAPASAPNPVADDSIVELRGPFGPVEARYWVFAQVGSPISLAVTMTRVGGKDGTSDTPATWTYDIADAITGASIATGVDPTQGVHEWRRPPKGKMTQASFGYGTLNAAGVFIVGWINEAPVVPSAAVFGIILAVAEQDSGSATAPANHTYNISDEITGASLGTFINPTAAPHKYKRPAVGRLAPANYGLAFMRQANAVLDPDLPDAEELVITWINEVPDVGACP